MDSGITRRRGPGEMVVEEMGAGPPLIFVHGFGSSGADAWPAQWPLADQIGGDRKLIRGAGHSPHRVGAYFNQVLEAFMAAKPLP